MDETVLVYIYKNDEVLMLYRNKKEHDINEGKWMGVGGHIETGETKEQALIREVKEETNLNVLSYSFRGTLLFINGDYQEKIYLYTVSNFSGDLIECNEGDLSFIKIKDVFDLKMWEGDYYFLRLLFHNEPYFELTLIYEGEKLVKIERTK